MSQPEVEQSQNDASPSDQNEQRKTRAQADTMAQLEADIASMDGSMPELELHGIAGSCFCHPYSWGHRIIAIFFMCAMGYGSYLVYDAPGALINQIESVMKVSDVEFGLLTSLYSWPNVVLPVVGGYLIDRVFGLRIASVIFIAFCILGQYLMALGAFMDSFLVMEISRFIFGMGGESLAVAQSTYAAAWFRGNALNTVFGLQLSISRVGSTTAYQLAAPVYNATLDWQDGDGNKALGWTMVILGFSTILSLVGGIVIGLLDRRKAVLTGSNLEEQPSVNLRDVLLFPLSVWLVCFVCVTFYVTIFPFVFFAKDLYMQEYHMSETDANFINGLIYLMSAFASPLFGFVIDRIGLNVFFVFGACVLTLIGHGTFLICLMSDACVNPYVGTVLMGLGYSMLAGSLWPIIALVVPQHRQGTAYGVVQAVQNLGLAVVPLLIGWIKDNYGWVALEWFNIGCLVAAIVGSLGLWLCSKVQHMGYLHMTTPTRDCFEKTQAYFDMMQKASGTRSSHVEGVVNPIFKED